MWDYAKLSKLAKLNGGPEKLVQLIANSGLKKGRLQMIPVALGALFLGIAVNPVINYLKSRHLQSEASLNAAKAELIQGIKEYDATHEKEGGGQSE